MLPASAVPDSVGVVSVVSPSPNGAVSSAKPVITGASGAIVSTSNAALACVAGMPARLATSAVTVWLPSASAARSGIGTVAAHALELTVAKYVTPPSTTVTCWPSSTFVVIPAIVSSDSVSPSFRMSSPASGVVIVIVGVGSAIIVTARPLDDGPALPAVSMASAENVWKPSASGSVVNVQSPLASAVVVPMTSEPSSTSIVLPASAVPESVGVVSVVSPSPSGAVSSAKPVMTGAVGSHRYRHRTRHSPALPGCQPDWPHPPSPSGCLPPAPRDRGSAPSPPTRWS